MSEPLIIFLGIAEHVNDDEKLPYPVGTVDIFGLTQNLTPHIYPFPMDQLIWLFAIQVAALKPETKLTFVLATMAEELIGFTDVSVNDEPLKSIVDLAQTNVKPANPFVLVQFSWSFTIPVPQTIKIYAEIDNNRNFLGIVNFGYKRQMPLTRSEMDAVIANPLMLKAIRMVLSCKNCQDKLRAYTAFDRIPSLEQQGFTWQYDLDDEYICQCGQTRYPLRYLRESFHSMLLVEPKDANESPLSYVRRYARRDLTRLARKFIDSIEQDTKEATAHKFIEDNQSLLAIFRPRHLFLKPSFLGERFADFIVLNSQGQLILIELEAPTLKLFDKRGGATKGLVHAFEQVTDWIRIYNEERSAVLRRLGIDAGSVMGIKGAVIAGREKNEDPKNLHRYFNQPVFSNNIELLTYDDLVKGMLQISRHLA